MQHPSRLLTIPPQEVLMPPNTEAIISKQCHLLYVPMQPPAGHAGARVISARSTAAKRVHGSPSASLDDKPQNNARCWVPMPKPNESGCINSSAKRAELHEQVCVSCCIILNK